MPYLERDGASIYYEESGSGFPLLLLAPGGLNSSVVFWGRQPLDPMQAFSDEFRVIAMDQRNADRSRGTLDTRDPWGTYAADQLALLDHLGVEQALTIGCCIGCSFIFKLVERQPVRVIAGVLMQPIGHDETNPGAFGPDTWNPWGESLRENGAEFSQETLDAFGHALFDPGFVFSVSREFLRTVQTPMLLLDGNDRAHPKGISVEVASLLPNVERIERWRDPDIVPEVTEQMRRFLRTHTPAMAT
jgi:pimeloyl-ACP methyl ester carboxylesterase